MGTGPPPFCEEVGTGSGPRSVTVVEMGGFGGAVEVMVVFPCVMLLLADDDVMTTGPVSLLWGADEVTVTFPPPPPADDEMDDMMDDETGRLEELAPDSELVGTADPEDEVTTDSDWDEATSLLWPPPPPLSD